MRLFMPVVLFAIAPAFAATPGEKPPEVDKAVGDAVTQPLADANLKKRVIPPEVLAVRDDPYSLEGVKTCNDIIAAVTALDSALGIDFDRVGLEDRGKTERRAARVAGGVIGGLIPFRGIFREVTGANKADDDYRQALFAAGVRRGFLKGLGQARRCLPPGRPLTDRERARDGAAMIAQDAANRSDSR